MKSNKAKKCNHCDACQWVYDRYMYWMWRRELHYCVLHEKIAERNDGCEDWRPRKRTEAVTVERCDKAIQDVEFLKVHAKDL